MKDGIKVPILVYHRLTPEDKFELKNEGDFYTVSSKEFEKQMSFLYDNGYQTITLNDFLNYQQGKCDIASKSIIVTFDDGYISNYNITWLVLKEFDFKATFFVVVKNIGSKQFLNWEQIKELSSSGIAFGSHGLSHRFLTKLSDYELEEELKDSKGILEEQLGLPVDFLSLPGGFYNKRVKRIVKECGYKGVCTSFIGLNDLNTDLFSLKRIAIKNNTSIEEFKQLLQMSSSTLLMKKLSGVSRKAFKGIVGIDNYMMLKERLIKVKR